MSKISVISTKLRVVTYIDFKDFSDNNTKKPVQQLNIRERFKNLTTHPSHIFEYNSTMLTHWAESYERRQKWRGRKLWAIGVVAGIFLGTTVWFLGICKTAWDKGKVSYMLDRINIPSYSIMAICVTISLILYYIYYKLSSTELLQNIRVASQQTNLNTINTFRLLNDTGIKENLVNILKLIFDSNNNTKAFKYNDKVFDIKELQRSITKILDIEDFKKIQDNDAYTLNISLDKFNKLLGLLIEKNHYYFIQDSNENQEKNAMDKSSVPKKIIIVDLLKNAFESNPPAYSDKLIS